MRQIRDTHATSSISNRRDPARPLRLVLGALVVAVFGAAGCHPIEGTVESAFQALATADYETYQDEVAGAVDLATAASFERLAALHADQELDEVRVRSRACVGGRTTVEADLVGTDLVSGRHGVLASAELTCEGPSPRDRDLRCWITRWSPR